MENGKWRGRLSSPCRVNARDVRAVRRRGDGERMGGVDGGGGAVMHGTLSDGEAMPVECLGGVVYPDAPHAAPLQRLGNIVELRQRGERRWRRFRFV